MERTSLRQASARQAWKRGPVESFTGRRWNGAEWNRLELAKSGLSPADVLLRLIGGPGFADAVLPHLIPVPVGVSGLSAREEITDDLCGRTNADLNVIQFAEAGDRIQGASLQEIAANRIERFLSSVSPATIRPAKFRSQP